MKPAREFHLIWRQNGRSPVTLWEPLPPQGYRALGTVVVPDAEQPGSKEVLCLREDLCSKTGIFDSPIWKFEPPIMQVILLNFCCLSAVSGKSQRRVRQVDCQVLSVRQCITSRDCTAHTSLLCLLEHDSDVASLMLQLAGKQAQRVHVLLGWLECATAEDVLSRDMALQLLASGQSSRHLPSQSLLEQAIQSSSTVCIRSSQQIGKTKAQLNQFCCVSFSEAYFALVCCFDFKILNLRSGTAYKFVCK